MKKLRNQVNRYMTGDTATSTTAKKQTDTTKNSALESETVGSNLNLYA